LTDKQKKLLDYYQDLSIQDQHSLLRYAEFLATGATSNESEVNEGVADRAVNAVVSLAATPKLISKPEKIAPPKDEKVVQALKRMSATYPMLDKSSLLNKASELVAQHVMFAKPAIVVIKDIEAMFATAYDKFVEDFGKDK